MKTLTVPLKEIGKYQNQDEWTVESLYENQCRKTTEDDEQHSGQHN